MSPGRLRQRLAATRKRGRCQDLLAEAFAGSDPDRRAVAASDWRCPPPLTRIRLSYLDTKSRSTTPRGTAAWAGRPSSHPAAHRFLLAAVAAKPEPAARESIAAHSGCGAAVLQRLASDSELRVRQAVAANTACGPAAAASLAHDPELVVQIAAVTNPACPAGVLSELSISGSLWLRGAVASNPTTPTPVLAHLAGENNDAVGEAAQRTFASRPKDRHHATRLP